MSAPRLVPRYPACTDIDAPPSLFVADSDVSKLETLIAAAQVLIFEASVIRGDDDYCPSCSRIPEEHGHEIHCDVATYQTALAALKEGERGDLVR